MTRKKVNQVERVGIELFIHRHGRKSWAVFVVLCAAWAFQPLGSTVPWMPESAPASPAQLSIIRLALDTDAFRTPLWIAPHAPIVPKKEPTPAPPPPLKLQLLAIRESNGYFKAILYDPDTDRVLVRSAGESAGQVMVERVAAGEVFLTDRTGNRTMALRPTGVRP